MKCDPKLGGILAICDVVKKEKCCENESNIEIDIKFPEAKSLNDSYQF
jgi:hypothetical protein